MEDHAAIRINRYLKLLVSITLAAIVFLIALLAYWSFYPYNPVVTYPKPYKIVYPEDKIIKQGGYLTYEFKYNKTDDTIPTIQRQFIDGLVFNVAGDSQPTITEPGIGVARVQIHVPETLPPGKYQLRILATYQMNPIRQVHNDSMTEKFEVISGRNSDAEQDTIQSNTENR